MGETYSLHELWDAELLREGVRRRERRINARETLASVLIELQRSGLKEVYFDDPRVAPFFKEAEESDKAVGEYEAEVLLRRP